MFAKRFTYDCEFKFTGKVSKIATILLRFPSPNSRFEQT